MRNAKQANALSRLKADQEIAVDLDLRVVGGGGFEPPTPAL